MERLAKSSRRPTRRPALAEKQARAQPGQCDAECAEAKPADAPSMPKSVDLLAGSSPGMPYHESLQPQGNVSSRNNPIPRTAASDAADNKRLSAITSEGQTNSNRNSVISTTSTISAK